MVYMLLQGFLSWLVVSGRLYKAGKCWFDRAMVLSHRNGDPEWETAPATGLNGKSCQIQTSICSIFAQLNYSRNRMATSLQVGAIVGTDLNVFFQIWSLITSSCGDCNVKCLPGCLVEGKLSLNNYALTWADCSQYQNHWQGFENYCFNLKTQTEFQHVIVNLSHSVPVSAACLFYLSLPEGTWVSWYSYIQAKSVISQLLSLFVKEILFQICENFTDHWT